MRRGTHCFGARELRSTKSQRNSLDREYIAVKAIMWFFCFAALTILAVATAWRYGPNVAVGATLLVSLLFPKWLLLDFAGAQLDLRVAAGISALAIYCLHPKSVFRTRLLALDYLMIAMLLIHATSDLWHEGFQWSIFARIYGEWMVPYLAGRVAIIRWEHARALTPVAIFVITVLVVLAACESCLHWRPYESLFGAAETDGPPRGLFRWGLLRAYGPTKNPIYFGTLLLLLTPWTVLAAVLAWRNAGPKVWLGAPLLIVVGILFSGSRGPLVAFVPLGYTMALILLPQWRRTFLAAGVVLVLLATVNYSYIAHTIASWSERTVRTPSAARINISGDEREYSNVLHRLYLWDVYSTAMRRAGWFGFGTESTTGFPPRVPIGPEQVETLKTLWCVDCEYVLMILRFGYLGVLCLTLCGVAATRTYWKLARQESLRWTLYAASMCGTVVATMCVLFTVWMPHDFGFWFLWTMAAGAGLYAHTGHHPAR